MAFPSSTSTFKVGRKHCECENLYDRGFVVREYVCVGPNMQVGRLSDGAIAGPFTAAQVAEYSSTNPFSVCTSSTCTAVRNWSTGVEGIDAQQNIGTQYQFYDQDYNNDANIAVGPTVTARMRKCWSG